MFVRLPLPVMSTLLVATLAVVGGCDRLAGVNPCGKTCAADKECGTGFACVDGRCAGNGCGGGGGTPGTSTATSAAPVSSSASRAASVVPSSMGAPSSSAGGASASSVGGVSAASSAGPSCSGASQGTRCGGNRFCDTSGQCVTACFFGGELHTPGNDPANNCQRCDPSLNVTQWVPNPNGSPCGEGPDGCHVGRCRTRVCRIELLCLDTTMPDCVADGGACQCNPSPDSCAAGTTNKRCLGTGMCGCSGVGDCAATESCTASTCQP